MTEEQKTDLYRVYYPKVFGYVRGKVNDTVLAEDVAANVFLKVYEKLDRFDEKKASVSTWIYTITSNTLTDYYRTRRVIDEIPETVDDGSSIEDDICSAETLETLADALESLPERERDLIVLRYYKKLTLKETAERLGISYAYVKTLHNKAIAAMRRIILPDDPQ